MPINRKGYKKSDDEKSYLSLEIGGSALVRILEYTQGRSPTESEKNDGSDITEQNRWGKYPHLFKMVVLGEEGNMKDIPLDIELKWESLSTGAWKILDYCIRGIVPDHPVHGKMTVIINRISEKEYQPEWFEDGTQDDNERDPEFSKYG